MLTIMDWETSAGDLSALGEITWIKLQRLIEQIKEKSLTLTLSIFNSTTLYIHLSISISTYLSISISSTKKEINYRHKTSLKKYNKLSLNQNQNRTITTTLIHSSFFYSISSTLIIIENEPRLHHDLWRILVGHQNTVNWKKRLFVCLSRWCDLHNGCRLDRSLETGILTILHSQPSI
jgi:hypothetical protein